MGKPIEYKLNRLNIKSYSVSVGIKKGELQEVFGELKPEDQIVKIASEELTEGLKIVIK